MLEYEVNRSTGVFCTIRTIFATVRYNSIPQYNASHHDVENPLGFQQQTTLATVSVYFSLAVSVCCYDDDNKHALLVRNVPYLTVGLCKDDYFSSMNDD